MGLARFWASFHLNRPPQSRVWSHVRPQTQPPLHDDLWAIIEKSLRKDPSERLGIQEFAQALQLFAGYEKAMFLEIEEVDIAEPSPQPTIARQSSPVFKGLPPDHNVTVSSLDFVPVPKRLIANSALEKKVSKPKFKTKVQPVKPSDTAKEVTQPQDPPSNIPEKIILFKQDMFYYKFNLLSY